MKQTSYTIKKLGDLCEIRTGKKDVNQGKSERKIPVFYLCARTHLQRRVILFDTEALFWLPENGDVGNVSYYKENLRLISVTYVLSDFQEH